MKQAEDIFTQDMHGEVITRDNSKPAQFRFYVVTADNNGGDHCTVWLGLTKKQARDMYAYTNAHQPSNVVACGWEELT